MAGEFGNWRGAVATIFGGGPSLSPAQVAAVRAWRQLRKPAAKVVVINRSVELMPEADMLYFCDERWYREHVDAVQRFAGVRRGPVVTLENRQLEREIPGLTCLEKRGQNGISLDPRGVCTGQNSGYQVLNFLLNLGVRRALLLGYDCKPAENGRTHWHDGHGVATPPSVYPAFLSRFREGARLFADAGLEIVNCTPGSALDCFRAAPLEEALALP